MRAEALTRGGSRGGVGGAPGARPLKLEKIWFFFLNRDFSHEISQKISRLPPLGAIFLSAPPPPLNWNPGSAPADYWVDGAVEDE